MRRRRGSDVNRCQYGENIRLNNPGQQLKPKSNNTVWSGLMVMLAVIGSDQLQRRKVILVDLIQPIPGATQRVRVNKIIAPALAANGGSESPVPS